MSNPIVENSGETPVDAQIKKGQVAAKIVKGNSEALNESGSKSIAAYQELTRAYQDLASRNSARLSDSIKQLSAVKTPTEFVQLQQKLVKEAFDAALADSQNIGDLTISVFNSAFEPIQRQIDVAEKAATH